MFQKGTLEDQRTCSSVSCVCEQVRRSRQSHSVSMALVQKPDLSPNPGDHASSVMPSLHPLLTFRYLLSLIGAAI